MGDKMELFNILEGFSGWCNEDGVKNAFLMVKKILEVLRIIVPIALIVMTSLDVAKKVINPEEKEGQKKIINRAIAAVIVFLVPTIIRILLSIIDVGMNAASGTASGESESNLRACWGD